MFVRDKKLISQMRNEPVSLLSEQRRILLCFGANGDRMRSLPSSQAFRHAEDIRILVMLNDTVSLPFQSSPLEVDPNIHESHIHGNSEPLEYPPQL